MRGWSRATQHRNPGLDLYAGVLASKTQPSEKEGRAWSVANRKTPWGREHELDLEGGDELGGERHQARAAGSKGAEARTCRSWEQLGARADVGAGELGQHFHTGPPWPGLRQQGGGFCGPTFIYCSVLGVGLTNLLFTAAPNYGVSNELASHGNGLPQRGYTAVPTRSLRPS